MAGILRLCAGGCRRLIPATRTRCDSCQRIADRRRNQRAKAHGRTSQYWRRLRARVLARDNYTCVRCGARATSVHIDPALNGDHRRATENDCLSMCHSCHGTTDAPRATVGGGVTIENAQTRRSPRAKRPRVSSTTRR